jgi:hypothetical protein
MVPISQLVTHDLLQGKHLSGLVSLDISFN